MKQTKTKSEQTPTIFYYEKKRRKKRRKNFNIFSLQREARHKQKWAYIRLTYDMMLCKTQEKLVGRRKLWIFCHGACTAVEHSQLRAWRMQFWMLCRSRQLQIMEKSCKLSIRILCGIEKNARKGRVMEKINAAREGVGGLKNTLSDRSSRCEAVADFENIKSSALSEVC